MTLSSTGTLVRDGRLISYWLAGPPGRPLVTFTHGAGLGHAMFDAQVALLASDYRVLTWDLPGQDYSQPMGDDFTVGTCADILLELVHEVGYDTAVLVGESLGSYIAQEYVYCYPQHARALVSVGATGITQHHAAFDRLGLKLTPHLIRGLPYLFVRLFTALMAGINYHAQAHAFRSVGRIRQRDMARAFASILDGLHEDLNYQIPVPTLIVHGEHDMTARVPAYAPGWAAQQPNSRLVVIPNAGHNANQDNAEYFNRILVDFLHQHGI